MSEIEVGEYIRTKDGFIDKLYCEIIDSLRSKDTYGRKIARCMDRTFLLKDIVKHSKNKIDLIEVGDIIYTYNVIYIYDNEMLQAVREDIQNGMKFKKIYTKEQLENIEYNV